MSEPTPLWLRIGGARIRVVGPAPCRDALAGWCAGYEEVEGPVDIGLNVRIDDSLSGPGQPVAMPLPFVVHLQDGVLGFERPGTRGSLRHLPGGALFVDVAGAGGRFSATSALRVALSIWLPARHGLLLHGSAVTQAGRALVFLGQSGRGKTTLSRLLIDGGAAPLEDEILVVRRAPGSPQWTAEGTPFGYRNPRARRPGAPIGATFLISHGADNQVAEPPLARRTIQLAASVISFGRDPAEMHAVLETVTDFAHDTRLKTLAFRPTPEVRGVVMDVSADSLASPGSPM